MSARDAGCQLGSNPLFCATWHSCWDMSERQRRLDAWAKQHHKPKETPRGKGTSS